MSVLHGLATAALRKIDPEDAHGLAVRALGLGLGPSGPPDDPILATTLAGMRLSNPVGLAAGFDKNAQVFAPMLRAGFGFVECGTVTPLPQPGNPRPRLFRLSEDRAVINRLGFNNQGLDAFEARLRRRGAMQVGANIGANKESEDRVSDYVTGLTRLWGLPAWFTVNISSPNTPGLRALQTRDALDDLLGRLSEARRALPTEGDRPMFLKVAPDLEDAEIEVIAASVTQHALQGVIVGNTTISRPPLRSVSAGETGGLSGAPLEPLATAKVRAFRQALGPELAIIGAGGVSSGAEALAKIKAGANAVQLYSALVFAGPGLVTTIKRALAAQLRAEGFASVAQAVGVS